MILPCKNIKYIQVKDLESKIKELSFDVNLLLKHKGYRNIPLTFEQAYMLGVFTLSPYAEELSGIFQQPAEQRMVQSVAALCTFHNKAVYAREESAEQIAGICAAIFDYDIGTSREGFLTPAVESVIDNCGMGGDLFRTPNLSTIAGLIAAAAGIKVLKHGSPGNTDNVGSSDFLAHCSVNLYADKAVVESAVAELNFGYTEALDEKYKRIHTSTHRYARLAHMNDIIGPITNPVHPRYMKQRIVGINHLIPPERVAQAYKILNEKRVTFVERVLCIRGFNDANRNGGIDEISVLPGGTLVAELNYGKIKTYNIYAEDFGLSTTSSEDLNPGPNKAEVSKRILRGEIKGGQADSALANAAIIFYLTENLNLKDGVNKARALLESGRPYKILNEYASYSNRIL